MGTEGSAPRIILASGSATRRRMLEAAGLAFEIVPAEVDEDAHRGAMGDFDVNGGPQRVASVLARVKAEEVSRRQPDSLVIGADQVLALDSEILTKAADVAAARQALGRLAGHTHHLHSAVALARGGAQVWSHLDSASMTMRAMGGAFLDDYVRRAGPGICHSVGAYEIEGLGIQLFDRIDGDYFTILGLPLLPLLAELRRQGALAG